MALRSLALCFFSTPMSLILNELFSQSSGRISVPDKAALDLLCSGSSGDIRSAINSLQFSSFTGKTNLYKIIHLFIL